VDVVTRLQPIPALRRPVLLAAFAGWNDAGEAATGAAGYLARRLGAEPFADISSEEFFDFQVNRPTVRTAEDGRRVLDWPRNRFSWARVPGSPHDVVLLERTEPNLRWQAFAAAAVGVAQELDVELVVTMGALQVDVPHTRPVPVTGSASTPALAERLGLRTSTYEGPTGITGVLHHACTTAGLDAMSLWAGVPHYLAATPYLAGALALLRRIGRLLGADLPLAELAEDAEAQATDIAAIVAEDDDLVEYVAELEERTAEDPGELPAPLVSGDEIAEELERYLRDRRGPDGA
jgi:proteasome assembly chaperone (PAC2) family protein